MAPALKYACDNPAGGAERAARGQRQPPILPVHRATRMVDVLAAPARPAPRCPPAGFPTGVGRVSLRLAPQPRPLWGWPRHPGCQQTMRCCLAECFEHARSRNQDRQRTHTRLQRPRVGAAALAAAADSDCRCCRRGNPHCKRVSTASKNFLSQRSYRCPSSCN